MGWLRSRVRSAALVLGAVALVAGCTLPGTSRAHRAADQSVPPPAPAPAGAVTWSARQDATLAPGSTLTATANASLRSLVVTDERGRVVPSHSTAQGMASDPLPPSRHFTATATYVDAAGTSYAARRVVSTAAPPRALRATITPGGGSTVGIGQPVVVTFNNVVYNRAAAERALAVSTDRPVGPAGWYWFSSTQVQYRPKSYWPAGTHVTVTARLADVRTGELTWGVQDASAAFTIGRAQILRIDDATHQMTVERDGRTLRTIPVSLGRDTPAYRTRSGTKTIMSREKTVHMDSSTVGIEGSDAYDMDVPFGLRLTWSGEYIHGAPWSEWAQGHQDVSHGCTNVSLSNAHWLYDNTMVGDPVETRGTGRPMEPGNGYGGAWDISWSAWQKGSALA